MACTAHLQENVAQATQLVIQAAEQGAQIVLLQELFETPYFCQTTSADFYAYARPLDDHPTIQHFAKVARQWNVVLPISVYERAQHVRYNTTVILDATGDVLGFYRKSHLPDGPGYEEKYYFSPGDTGFRVWRTTHATIGVGICWDQWFPEAARCMAVQGAELLLYPTAIGSEPHDATMDSKGHWEITMRGHAAANMMPVLASNRIGTEVAPNSAITFFGSSFIAGAQGQCLTQLDRHTPGIALATFDLEACAHARSEWGLFRDRRPDLYHPLLTVDGTTRPYMHAPRTI